MENPEDFEITETQLGDDIDVADGLVYNQEEEEEEEEQDDEDDDDDEDDEDDDLGIVVDGATTTNINQGPGISDNILLDDESDVTYVSQDDDSNISTDEEEDDDDLEYIRIDQEFKDNFMRKIHPEEILQSVTQMNASSVVSRDQDNVVIDENHVTIPLLTKYEKARVLGLRITQLNKGAKPLVEYNSTIIDNHIIAELELRKKKIPFIVMRPLPNGSKEYWRLEDLEIVER